MRKLATVRKVSEVLPIADADAIELCVVDGWRVVTKKDEFKPGDVCVYCEIDSYLPIRPEFEFLRKSSYKKMQDGTEGFRLRTAKLRGSLSQGLLLKPQDFTELSGHLEIGQDVSELLGITLYSPPIPAELSGLVKGLFPSFIPKTDEERIQNLKEVYSQLREKPYYVTEKLDGSSATFYITKEGFGVCSRNLELKETETNTFWVVARKLDLENKLRIIGQDLALQGELVGPGIQGNPYKLKEPTVYFFSAFDITEQRRIGLKGLKQLMKDLDTEMVPLLDQEFELPYELEDLLELADGKSYLTPEAQREGLVIRSLDSVVSFKVISNAFLLKQK
jgi:RNA ligase (TIGR02306 family)